MRPGDQRPAVGNGERQRHRDRDGDPDPRIGNETQQGGEQTPEHRVRDADEVERDAEGNAEARVDHELHEEIPAHALGGLAERLGRQVDAPCPDQADQPVTHVLAVQQHENGKDDHGERNAERLGERRDPFHQRGERRSRGLLHRERRLLRGRLLLQVADRLGGLAELALARCAQRADLGADVFAVFGQLGGQRNRLARREPAHRADDREAQQHDDGGGRDTTQPPALELAHRRRQQEAQQDRERERDQDIASQVEDRR